MIIPQTMQKKQKSHFDASRAAMQIEVSDTQFKRASKQTPLEQLRKHDSRRICKTQKRWSEAAGDCL
jgi:hypothetical protein